MKHSLLIDNQKKYSSYPCWLLILFSFFNYWKQSVMFFTVACVPYDPHLKIQEFLVLFVAANAFSIIFMTLFPQKVVLAERTITILALCSLIALFLPSPNIVAICIFYFHAMCCFATLGFEYFIIANLFSEKSAITYLTLGYGISFILIAIIHNHFVRYTFLQYKISTIVILLLLLYVYFRLPSQINDNPSYIKKQDDFAPPRKMLLGTFSLAFIGSFLAHAGPNIAGLAQHGTFIMYLANAAACFLLYFFYKKKMHPFHFVSFCLCFGCIGPLLMYASFWSPMLKYVACICIGFSMIPSQLAPLCAGTLMRIYPSKYIVPVISAMFLVSFASQHLLAGAMRESMFSYYIFLSISMIILTTFYLQIAPTFLYVLTKRKREILLKIESLQAAEPVEESQEPEVSTSSPTTAAVENDFLQKLSKRELEVVDLIAQGYTNADIAKTLYISAHTVNDHTKNIYRKLDVHSRYELIALLNQNKNGGA